MTWNYRVIRRFYEGFGEKGYVYRIHEVYYSKEGEVNRCTKEAVFISGETLIELKADFDLYMKALTKPTLDYETLKEINDEME